MKWVSRWRFFLSPSPVLPGVYRRMGGGYVIRARAVNPNTKKLVTVCRVVPAGSAQDAYRELQIALTEVRQRTSEKKRSMPLFADYCLTSLDRRIKLGSIKSAKSREKYRNLLAHHILPVLGEKQVNEITKTDLLDWQVGLREKLAPRTCNTTLAVLKSFLTEAVEEFSLTPNPLAGLKPIDVSDCPTYTEEEPNALTVPELRLFLDHLRVRYPQHFAFVYLGLVTGLRPSSLRPIRCEGPKADLRWHDGTLLVRRSHTKRQEVMETTKTRKKQRLALPPAVINVLRWHWDTQLTNDQRATGLLFPGTTNGFRSSTSLDKPFRTIAREIGLKKHVTPRAMRRTFQDLARAVGLRDVVTRAVSGHATEEMQERYSTVNAQEMREALGKVTALLPAVTLPEK